MQCQIHWRGWTRTQCNVFMSLPVGWHSAAVVTYFVFLIMPGKDISERASRTSSGSGKNAEISVFKARSTFRAINSCMSFTVILCINLNIQPYSFVTPCMYTSVELCASTLKSVWIYTYVSKYNPVAYLSCSLLFICKHTSTAKQNEVPPIRHPSA